MTSKSTDARRTSAALAAGPALREIFARFGQKTFLVESFSGRSFTYDELAASALDFAARLRAAGLAPGARIGIILENSAESAAAYFACLAGGFVAVPVSVLASARDVRYMLEAADVSAIVSSPATRDLLPAETSGLRVGMPALDGGAASATGGAFATIDPRRLFVITFTSGTTSRPKGVPHTFAELYAAARAFNTANGFDEETRLYHVFHMTYMAGLLNTLLCPFFAGGTVILDHAFGAQSALRFWRAPIAHRVNTLWLVPTILASLLRLDRDEEGRAWCRGHIRHACVGTAPLPRRVQVEFEDRYGVSLLESYGLSETLFTTANRPGRPRKAASVGSPLADVDIRIVDPGGTPLTADADGEIEIRSPFTMPGYLDPATHEPVPLASDWFASGDLGHIDAGGDLTITGRRKDLIIRGGLNVSPRSIEEVLLEHRAVEDAAVVGVPHEFYGEDIVAFLELRRGFALPAVEEEIRAHCRAALSPAALPSRIEAVAAFPRTSNGKIRKSVLAARAAGRPENGEDAAP